MKKKACTAYVQLNHLAEQQKLTTANLLYIRKVCFCFCFFFNSRLDSFVHLDFQVSLRTCVSGVKPSSLLENHRLLKVDVLLQKNKKLRSKEKQVFPSGTF